MSLLFSFLTPPLLFSASPTQDILSDYVGSKLNEYELEQQLTDLRRDRGFGDAGAGPPGGGRGDGGGAGAHSPSADGGAASLGSLGRSGPGSPMIITASGDDGGGGGRGSDPSPSSGGEGDGRSGPVPHSSLSSAVLVPRETFSAFHGMRPPAISIDKYLERIGKYSNCRSVAGHADWRDGLGILFFSATLTSYLCAKWVQIFSLLPIKIFLF